MTREHMTRNNVSLGETRERTATSYESNGFMFCTDVRKWYYSGIEETKKENRKERKKRSAKVRPANL